MNGFLCLEWCQQYGHRFPDDYRTAVHVVEFIADKAAEVAWNDEEREAVNVARAAALDLLRSRGWNGGAIRWETGETNAE